MGAQSVRRDSLAASVADMQNSNRIALDGEQNPVYVRPTAIEQVPHLKRGFGVFGSKRTTGRRDCKRCNGILQRQKPPDAGIPSMLGKQPLQNGFGVAFGFRCRLNQKCYISGASR